MSHHVVRVMPCCSSSYGYSIALTARIRASAAVPWNRSEVKQKSNPKEPMTQLSPNSYGIRNELLVQKIDGSGRYLHVPEAPGLGTTVDEQVLSSLATI